jgi:hypothetical protein
MECIDLGGSAKIKSVVSPITDIEGMKCLRRHNKST